MYINLLPWQTTLWTSLQQRIQQNRLPHALLFSGPAGVGKKQFAHAVARQVLCETLQACGTCRSCHFMQANTHPDFMVITPEEDSDTIKIDAIRQVVNTASETALLGGYRIFLLYPATAMNHAAANALLKTLEEPASKIVFILIADQSLQLPATIISRCQRIDFPKPSRDIALTWLASETTQTADFNLLLNLADGAPLKAKEFLTNAALPVRQMLYTGLGQLSRSQADPLQLAAQFTEKNAGPEKSIDVILQWTLLWLKDLLRAFVTNGQADLVNYDYKSDFNQLITKLSREKLLSYIDYIQKIVAQNRQTNLNKQLLLEDILIRWMRTCF
jgi:DNA polymerase-3 subunit delta'